MKREHDHDDIQDLHANGDVEAVTEEIYGREGGDFDPMEIWLESVEEDQHLDVNDFPPLPDFPCMSSSSSTSSVPAGGLPKPSSSSTASSSSSSAASWAVLKSDAEEDAVKTFHLHAQLGGAAMTPSCGSMGGAPPPPPLEDSFTDDDCINVMENLGYMDFMNGDDIWDPISIFQTDNFHEEPVAAQQESQFEEQPNAVEAAETSDLSFLQGNSELAVIFFEWLKQNKDYISAEDMRNIKLKRSTIESASKRLGSSKEGKKQLLKLILDWVQQYQLQKKKSREEAEAETAAVAVAVDANQPEAFLQSPNSNFPAETTPACFYPAPWTTPPPPQYIPDSNNAAMPPPFPVFQPPAMGFNNIDPYGGAPFAPMNSGQFSHSKEFHQPAGVDTAQSWPSTEFVTAASQSFYPYPENDSNRIAAESAQQPALYGSECPYQLFDGNGERLVRLGSSATKEARKKRMARQRRFSNHHFRHQNHHNNHHSQNYDHHHTMRMSVDSCNLSHQVSNLGNWVYWSPAAAASEAPPPQVVIVPPADVAAPPVERPPPPVVQQQNNQKQGCSSERRQGSKTEKNLKFLLQKVLKQSDVGSLGRIVLPKKEAETQLPELESRDGIFIAMEDIGTSRVWNMKYRFWPNNKSRMYLLENTGDFVRANGLQEGDFIVIYADMKCGKYLIRGVKVRQHGPRSDGKKPARKNPRTLPSSPVTNSPAISLIKQTVN